jgi:hypothetical protein
MNFPLYNDKVWTFPLKCQNSSGIQPWPAGSNPVATSSNPASLTASANAILGFGNAITGYALVLTPKVQASPGLTVTVANVGMDSIIFTVDIVSDPGRFSVVVDTADTDYTISPQNVPAATGP